jgi:hypothetical protein
MKHILFTLLFLFSTVQLANCQTWQTVSRVGTYETIPFSQFSIDPYSNDIWLVRDTKVSVIQDDGSIHIFTDAELGTLWTGDNIQFVFTPTDVYYNITLFGFHSFTGYNSTLIDANYGAYNKMTSNGDTVYIALEYPNGFVKYCNGNSQTFYKWYKKIVAKNQFLYGTDGSSAIFEFFQSSNTQASLMSDPEYLYTIYHDTKFSRHSDTLYVGGKKGISYAYNYDFLDTITPNNTMNMPSPNVLEIEFDHLDSLWAVFGDVNDVPFAIAKLEGSTWNNIYNASNSPINFSNFLGLEIDTLGNLWVADYQSLHTLLTPNSPTWLNVNSLDLEQEISIYPNPGSSTISIQNLNNFDAIKIVDLQGRVVIESTKKDNIDVSTIHRGQYVVQILQNGQLNYLIFVKE